MLSPYRAKGRTLGTASVSTIVVRDLEDAERLATALKEYTRDRKRWTAHHGTRQPIG